MLICETRGQHLLRLPVVDDLHRLREAVDECVAGILARKRVLLQTVKTSGAIDNTIICLDFSASLRCKGLASEASPLRIP